MFESLNLSPGVRVTLVGALTNLFLSVCKFFGGWLGNSTAMMTDAVHSVSDLLTDGVVLITHKIGQTPKDENHPYGHGRVETLGSVIIGIIIISAGIGVGMEAWGVLQKGTSVTPNALAAVMAGVSILANEWLYRYTRKIGKSTRSPTIIANAWHHRSDALSSIAALLGICGAMLGYSWMDPAAALIVAVMIFKIGWDLIQEALRDLMDTAVEEDLLERIRTHINSIPDVLHAHDLRTRRIGGEVFLDVHIMVNRESTVTEGHQVAEEVRHRLLKEFKDVEDVLVHVDTENEHGFSPLYLTSREQLQEMADTVIQSTREGLQRTRFRVHYYKGTITVEVFVRLKGNVSANEIQDLLQGLRTRLTGLKEIDFAKVYWDPLQDS